MMVRPVYLTTLAFQPVYVVVCFLAGVGCDGTRSLRSSSKHSESEEPTSPAATTPAQLLHPMSRTTRETLSAGSQFRSMYACQSASIYAKHRQSKASKNILRIKSRYEITITIGINKLITYMYGFRYIHITRCRIIPG